MQMRTIHKDRSTSRSRHIAELPDSLRPVPAHGRARPFWLELAVAFIFSLAALLAVSNWVEACNDPARGCFGLSVDNTPAPALTGPDPSASALKSPKPPMPSPEERAVLTHAFAPLPLSFEDRTTRHYVLPPGQSMLDMATQTARIPMDEVALIAVVQQAGVRHALVRLPDGRILRLQQGDRLEGGTVAAIGEDALYLIDEEQRPRALVLGG